MKKNKLSQIVLFISAVIFSFGLITVTYARRTDSINEQGQSNLYQKNEFHVLIVNCQTSLYSELCDFVSSYFNQAGIPYALIQRNHNNLQDIINSKFKEIDLLIISGSSKFLPDDPEVRDVTTLLKTAIEQNKYGFGVCGGMQFLAYLLDPEKGKLMKKGSWDKDVAIHILYDDLLFEGVGMAGDSFVTRQYHNYSVPFSGKEKLGQGQILAKSKDGIEIIRIGNVVATQFHPESIYASVAAKRVFQNYLKKFISNNRK